MRITLHEWQAGTRWAVDGMWLPREFTLGKLLAMPGSELAETLVGSEPAGGTLLAPCDPDHEVWASGVTYLRSRVEREAESSSADLYARVYDAERPELFFKSSGWRARGHGDTIRVRSDSDWNVPEPELTLVVNRFGEIVGYTAGNDVSSRSIEGENALYLPQAKCYDGACALGPAIEIGMPGNLEIRLEIERRGERVFQGATSTAAMRRACTELVGFLFRECAFPNGVLLMTGTGIVPAHPFTLSRGDRVRIEVGTLLLENRVADS